MTRARTIGVALGLVALLASPGRAEAASVHLSQAEGSRGRLLNLLATRLEGRGVSVERGAAPREGVWPLEVTLRRARNTWIARASLVGLERDAPMRIDARSPYLGPIAQRIAAGVHRALRDADALAPTPLDDAPEPRSEAPAEAPAPATPSAATGPERRQALTSRPLLDVRATLLLGAQTRHLRYRDDLFGNLRDYRMPGAPIASGALELGVGRRGEHPMGGMLRFAAGGTTGATSARDVYRYATQHGQLSVQGGLSARLSAEHRVSLRAGYDRRWHRLAPAAAEGFELSQLAETPSVDYRSLSVDAGYRFARARYVAEGWLGALRTHRLGGISDVVWFPRASALGLRFGGALEIALSPYLASRIELAYARYALTLDPALGSTLVASGASDQMLRLSAGLRFGM